MHANIVGLIQGYLSITEHIEVADEFSTSKNRFNTIFIIEPRHPGCLKKQIWVKTIRSGSPGHMRRNAYYSSL